MSALFAAAVCTNAEEAKPKKVSFYSDIRPILQGQCHGCHQPAKAKGEYVMTTFEQLLARRVRARRRRLSQVNRMRVIWSR